MKLKIKKGRLRMDRYTKGDLIKELKKAGVRRGITNSGTEVSLEHLKYADVINLYYSHCK